MKKHPYPVVRMTALEALTADNVEEAQAFQRMSGSLNDGSCRWMPLDFGSDQVGAFGLRMLRDKINKMHYHWDGNELMEVNGFNIDPSYGIKFGNGYLLGYDYGEWGGGLVYFDKKTSKATRFSGMPVPLILNAKAGVFAFANVGSISWGAILYRIELAQNGRPLAKPVFRVLPDANVCLWKGDLYVGWGMSLTSDGFKETFPRTSWTYGSHDLFRDWGH